MDVHVKHNTFTVVIVMTIEKNFNMILLFDCYQSLLTEKQRLMMDLYYNHDFSLAEISESLHISRQGVYDHLKRTERLLEEYEESMKLKETTQSQNRLIEHMWNVINRMESAEDSGKLPPTLTAGLEELKKTLKEMERLNFS